VADLETANRYLKRLDAGGKFTFQTLAEAPDATGDAGSPRVLHGTFAQYGDELARLNKLGAGIFVMVNEGDGVVRTGCSTCRTAANVVRIRALFVDLDGSPIEPVLGCELPPDFVVRTSPGRFHAYWRVGDVPLDDFGRVQHELAVRFSGDLSVKDLPRIMRIPGFFHRKHQPYMSELLLPADFDQLVGERHGSD
jgi:hypothetical protein